MRRMRWALLVPVLCLAVASISHAGTTATTLTVSATVGSACSISASALDFGAVTGGQQAQAQTQLTVQCPVDLPYQITLGAGLHPGGPGGTRQVSHNNTDFMQYLLCPTSTCDTIWGDQGFEDTFNFPGQAGTGTGVQQVIPVYGVIGPPASPAVGAYSDTVAVTVHFGAPPVD